MTLREEIVKINERALENLKQLSEFANLANTEIIIDEDITYDDLYEYFASNDFKLDIIHALKNMHILIKRYSYFNLSEKHFLIFFSSKNPLHIDVEALIH